MKPDPLELTQTSRFEFKDGSYFDLTFHPLSGELNIRAVNNGLGGDKLAVIPYISNVVVIKFADKKMKGK